MSSFDAILLLTFETKQMTERIKRCISSEFVHNMLAFSRFKFKKLKFKTLQRGKVVIDESEAYKSRTVSWTGKFKSIGYAKCFSPRRDSGKVVTDRDCNDARGIILCALIASSMKAILWLSCCFRLSVI